jgi:hypothetical protein
MKSTRYILTSVLMLLLSISIVRAQSFTNGNLAVFVAASSSGNNTTGSIVELNTTSAGQSALTTHSIDGTTSAIALRFSGSATSTAYLSNSNDGSLLTFTGGQTNGTSANINTITTRGIGTYNGAGTFNLATTYTGASGNQTRSATTTNNSTFYIGDQGGLYTNSGTTASVSTNLRALKSFGGTVYALTSAATNPVGTYSSATATAFTALPGSIGTSPTITAPLDFYMVSSGSNGTTYDILYMVIGTSATAGIIYKYSLVSGSWVSNGSYTTTIGGFGMIAKWNGTGSYLYVTSGTGATAANSVVRLTDAAGYNSTINITTANNITLYTSAAGTTVKGIAFAPITLTPTISTTGTLSAVNTTYGTASSSPTSFSVSGVNMTAGILVTPPTGYEVCLTIGGTYTSTVTVGSSGTISSTTVYVRLKATSTVAGSPYSGNIVLSSSGATSVNVATISSTVSTLSVSTTGAAAQNKSYDGNTTATITGASVVGAVNGDALTVSGGGTFASAAVGTGISVSANLTLGGTNSSSYLLTQPTGLTADIIAATCNAPSSPSGTATSATAANISWSAASSAPASGYDYEVRSSGAAGSGSTGLDASGNTSLTSVSISTLNASTTYTLYVRSNCSSNQSSWIASSTFSTPALVPIIVLSNGSIAAAPINQNTTNNILYRTNVTVSTVAATLSSASFTLAGTYSASDLANLKLWYQSSSTFNSNTATLLGTLTSALGTGAQTFGSLNQTFAIGTNYLFVTTDLICAATPNATINVNASTLSDFSFVSATPSGSFTAGGAQTITAITVNNASSVSTTPLSASASVSWSNPTGCYDEVMIVVAPATNNGVPIGNSYTANLAYTLGTSLGNGYVVYKGTTSPQTIIGLTNGTTYSFKIFTRNGTTWSTGTTDVTALPTSGFTAFTAGSIVVGRCDQSGLTTASNGAKYYMDEYSTSGTSLVSNRSLPTTVSGNNLRLVLSGSSTSDGHITLSPDTKYLICGGYDAAVNTSGVSSSASTTVTRVVGILDAVGTIDTRSGFNTSNGFSGNNFRGGITDGNYIWGVGAGTGGGVRVIPFSAPGGTTANVAAGTQLSTTSTNCRAINIVANQLWVNAGSGVFAPSTVGTGLPITSGQTITTPSGLPTAGTNGYDFIFFDRDATVSGNDLLYIADLTSGITKYSYNGTTWTARGSVVAAGTAPAAGIGSLIGKINCNDQIELYCVWGNGSVANKVYKFVDAAAYNANITSSGLDITTVGTLVATSSATSSFKGISWAPTQGNLTVASGNTNASGIYNNITVSGGTLTLTGDIYADNITIQNGGTIDCSTFKILSNGIGKSTFDLQNGATLKTANTAGITASSATGSVQTCVRNYSSSAIYIYNGSSAQVTGDGLPSTITTLTISNSAGVTLTASTSATTLNLTSGVLTTGSSNVMTIASGGSVSGASTTSFVNGNLQKIIATGTNVNITFEVGSNAKYSSITLNFPSVTTAGTIQVASTSGDRANLSSSCITASKSVNRYWSISFPSAPLPAIYNATVNYQSSDVDGSITAANVIAAMFGSSWSYALATTNFTTSSISITGINTTSTFDLQIGEGNAAAPTVSSPATYCQYNTIAALTATGTNKLWYTAINSTSSSSTAPTPSTATAGTPIGSYFVTQTASGCTSNRSEIVVNINASPNSPTVSNVNYCQNATTSQLTAIGTSLMWYTVAVNGTGSSTAPTPTAISAGTTSYWVTQNNGTCESQRAQLDVTVIAAPTAPSVTTPVGFCQGVTASQLTATGVNLLWYTTSTTGTGGSSTAPTPSTTSIGTPTISYWVTQTIGGCPESPAAQIDVNVYSIPTTPIVTTPVTYCLNDAATQLTATGSNLLWYTVSTNGTSNATAPTPVTSSATTINNYVSQTVNGCESPRALLAVVVNALPTIPTSTSPINYCQNVVASVLSATGTNLLWYTSSIGGIGSATAPTPNTATTGIPAVSYFVSQTNTTTGCESNRKQIDVNVYGYPSVPSSSTPINLCQNSTPSALSATGSNIQWYTVSTGGTGSATAPTPSALIIGAPAVSYYVSQTVNGCESPLAQINVNVYSVPTAPAVTTPVVYTQGTSASTLTATGSNLTWYTVSTGGIGSSTAPTPSTTATGNPSSQYWVSETTNGCESPRSLINVRITGIPFIPGNLAVLRLGTGTALSSSASQVTIDEYSTNGTIVRSRPMPSSTLGTNYALTNSGSAGSEGALSFSPNHQYLALAGYNATVGTTSVATSTVGRVVGIVDNYGEINTSTIIPTAISGNNIRGAVTTNGTDIWATGPNGIIYTTVGSNSNGVALSSSNVRAASIVNGQLIVSTSTALSKVGTGLPTTTSQTLSSLVSVPSGNVYSSVFFDEDPNIAGVDLVYIADQTNGLLKYSYNGTTWTSRGSITATGGCTGIAGFESCTGIELYVTVGTAAGNKIHKFVDAAAYSSNISSSGSAITTVGVIVATAPTNTIFRGLSLTPYADLVINSNQTLSGGTYGNITINSGATVTLLGNINLFGTLTVAANSTLDCGSYTIASSGNFKSVFDLQNGATLKISSADGITKSTSLGNIQTCVRNFSTSANYIYYSSVAQNTGDALPTTINSLVVNNAAGLTLADNLQVTGFINFISGKIIAGNKIIGTSGNISGHNATNYIHGSLRRTIPVGTLVNVDFPVGDATAYAPVKISSNAVTTAGDIVVSSIINDYSKINTSCFDPLKTINRYWQIKPINSFVAANYTAQVYYVNSDFDASVTTSILTGEYYSGLYASWNVATISNVNTANAKFTNLNAMDTVVLQLGKKICTTPANDNPCTASANSGQIAGLPTVFAAFDDGSSVHGGIDNNPNANSPVSAAPYGPNLIYYTGNTLLSGNLGASEPIPSCNSLGSNPKTVWYKFKVPALNPLTIYIRSTYPSTSFITSLTAYTASSPNPCSSPTFTEIGCASGTSLTNNATLALSSSALSALAGQYVYLQIAGVNNSSGNFMISVQASAPSISLTNPTTTTLKVNFPSLSNVSKISLYWKAANSNGVVFTYVPTTSSSYTIGGLKSGVNYIVWAKYTDINGSNIFTINNSLGTTVGCGGTLLAPTVTGITNHCSQVNVNWPSPALQGISGVLIPAPSTYPYRLVWTFTNGFGFHGIVQAISSLPANGWGIVGLPLNTNFNFYYTFKCVGGALVSSASTNYTTCSGAARESSHSEYVINGVHYVDATDEELMNALVAEIADDGQQHEFNLVNVVNKEAISQEEITANPSVNLSPNPTHSIVNIQYNLPTNEADKIIINVMDINGSVVKNIEFPTSSFNGNYALDITEFKQGIFIVTFKAGNFTSTQKLVKID